MDRIAGTWIRTLWNWRKPGCERNQTNRKFWEQQLLRSSVYYAMQGVASHKPISTLYNVWQKTNRDGNDNGALCLTMHLPFEQIEVWLFQYSDIACRNGCQWIYQLLLDLHQIELRDKLIHYALASQGKRGFDTINIVSESKQVTPSLTSKPKETEIFDVKKIYLSKRQKWRDPGRQRTYPAKDRDMRFGGKLFAGFALFQRKDMNFEYEKFQVEFDSVRAYMVLHSTGEMDKYNQPIAYAMGSNIEHISGALLVDAPNNKSGKRSCLFSSLQSKILLLCLWLPFHPTRRLYTRLVLFPLNHFLSMDSTATQKTSWPLKTVSGYHFPNFKKPSWFVMKTNRLDLFTVHRQKGIQPTNKGKYTGKLDLNNNGLLGIGKLEYLTAEIESEDLIFKPKANNRNSAQDSSWPKTGQIRLKLPQAKGGKRIDKLASI